MEKIVLASSSPRRRELMARAGFRFEVIVSEADENIEMEAPDRMVEELSKRKAGAVAELVKTQGFAEDSVLIVGADTMVSIDGKKLGKPAGEAGAEAMLKELFHAVGFVGQHPSGVYRRDPDSHQKGERAFLPGEQDVFRGDGRLLLSDDGAGDL